MVMPHCEGELLLHGDRLVEFSGQIGRRLTPLPVFNHDLASSLSSFSRGLDASRDSRRAASSSQAPISSMLISCGRASAPA